MDDLVRELGAYLEDPTRDEEGRARAVEWICGPVDGHTHERTAAWILAKLGLRRESAPVT